MQEQVKVPKVFLDIINQIFEIEKKASLIQEPNSIQRNVNKLKDIFENEFLSEIYKDQSGFNFYNPIGEAYNETRTDCEATIQGINTNDLQIKEVIKPIIRYKRGGVNTIIQKAVVIAESKQ